MKKTASISTARLPKHRCPDGYVWVEALNKCVPIHPIIKDVALIQGGNCWPPMVRIARVPPPLRDLITKVGEKELRQVAGQIRNIESLERQARHARAPRRGRSKGGRR